MGKPEAIEAVWAVWVDKTVWSAEAVCAADAVRLAEAGSPEAAKVVWAE